MSIFAYKDQDGTINVTVCGNLVRDAEIKSGNNGSRVKFTVCYAKKKYMDCEAWADNDVGAVAALLEKNDVVSVSGTHRSWEYNGKEYSTLSADMISTLAVPQAFEPGPPVDQSNSESSSPFSEIADTDGELPF